MKSRDVKKLYDQLSPGALVQIVPDRFPKLDKASVRAVSTVRAPTTSPPEKAIFSKAQRKPEGDISGNASALTAAGRKA
jgi:hypothetical protein